MKNLITALMISLTFPLHFAFADNIVSVGNEISGKQVQTCNSELAVLSPDPSFYHGSIPIDWVGRGLDPKALNGTENMVFPDVMSGNYPFSVEGKDHIASPWSGEKIIEVERLPSPYCGDGFECVKIIFTLDQLVRWGFPKFDVDPLKDVGPFVFAYISPEYICDLKN